MLRRPSAPQWISKWQNIFGTFQIECENFWTFWKFLIFHEKIMKIMKNHEKSWKSWFQIGKIFFVKMFWDASRPLRAIVEHRKRPLEVCNVDCATPDGSRCGSLHTIGWVTSVIRPGGFLSDLDSILTRKCLNAVRLCDKSPEPHLQLLIYGFLQTRGWLLPYCTKYERSTILQQKTT